MKFIEKIKLSHQPRCVLCHEPRNKVMKDKDKFIINDDLKIVRRKEVQGTRRTDDETVRVFRKYCYCKEKRVTKPETGNLKMLAHFNDRYQDYAISQSNENLRELIDYEVQKILDNMKKRNK